jgi:hypothetical protein
MLQHLDSSVDCLVDILHELMAKFPFLLLLQGMCNYQVSCGGW